MTGDEITVFDVSKHVLLFCVKNKSKTEYSLCLLIDLVYLLVSTFALSKINQQYG